MKKWLWTLAAIGLTATACSRPFSSTAASETGPVTVTAAENQAADPTTTNFYTDVTAAEYAEDTGSAQPASELQLSPVTLEVTASTPSFTNESLVNGPVEVKVSYTSREADAGPYGFSYQIFYDGELQVENQALALGYGKIILGDFDQNGHPEVAVQGFTGGAHCCTSSVIYSWRDGNFVARDLSEETIGGEFKDVDGDGTIELVTVDSAFLGRFSSYAGSAGPPLIFAMRAGDWTEATREYPEIIRADIAELEDKGLQNNPALLSAYVANKILVGEREAGWAFMLENYGSDPEIAIGMNQRDENGNVIGRYPDFPTALEAFLTEESYL